MKRVTTCDAMPLQTKRCMKDKPVGFYLCSVYNSKMDYLEFVHLYWLKGSWWLRDQALLPYLVYDYDPKSFSDLS